MSARKYGATTTAAEIVHDVDMHGRRVVVTGASSGSGVETARALASTGAEVTLAVRNVEAGAKVAAAIAEKLSPGAATPQVARLDLADPTSVADFVRAWSGPLHVLVNNAGVMALPELTRTPSGYEMQFATNHLGHFALTTGLHQWLAAANGARVVAVASIGHLFSPVVFDDLHYRFRPYDQWTSYGQSKSAIVGFAVGAAHRWADDGIVVNALMPGNIASTALASHWAPTIWPTLGDRQSCRCHQSRRSSKTPPRQCYWRPVPTSKGSPAATTRTAPRRRRYRSASAAPAASPPTYSTAATPSACGRSPTN
jgi:NAD(P)-dependent dehydrogenase (short-subunit alcohol dehydrogenase family)